MRWMIVLSISCLFYRCQKIIIIHRAIAPSFKSMKMRIRQFSPIPVLFTHGLFILFVRIKNWLHKKYPCVAGFAKSCHNEVWFHDCWQFGIIQIRKMKVVIKICQRHCISIKEHNPFVVGYFERGEFLYTSWPNDSVFGFGDCVILISRTLTSQRLSAGSSSSCEYIDKQT